MNYKRELSHSFAVCAHGSSPYLEQTIQSLLGQSISSPIRVFTSTDNDHIRMLCKKYSIEQFINPEQNGIAADWNYAYDHSESDLVTLAHQDDWYEPSYAEMVLHHAGVAKDPIIIFTNYYEIRNDVRVNSNRVLRIKRHMLAPLLPSIGQKNIFLRRRILSFGDPICCPSVTYVKKQVGKSPFDVQMKNSMDYQLFAQLSSHPGSFVYVKDELVGHRIHDLSATTENIESAIRRQEDRCIMTSFWPAPIAEVLNILYESSEKSNTLSSSTGDNIGS